MLLSRSLPLFALAMVAVAAPAQAQSGGFQLPPNPSPTASPDVQGPVDETAPVPVRPRAIPTATPAPTPIPTAQPSPRPSAVPTTAPSPVPTRAPQPRPTATAAPSPRQTATPGTQAAPTTSSIPTPAPSQQPTSAPSDDIFSSDVPPVPAQTPADSSPELAATGESGSSWWIWLVAALALIVAAIAGFAWWKRREANAPVPEIEPPLQRAADLAATRGPADVALKFELDRVSRSLMKFMVTYNLTLTNRCDYALRDISIGSDLVSARQGTPVAQQVANEATEFAASETVDRLGPHQSRMVTIRRELSLADAHAVVRGANPMFIPFLRMAVTARDLSPRVLNYVIGEISVEQSGKLKPLPIEAPPGGLDNVGAQPVG